MFTRIALAIALIGATPLFAADLTKAVDPTGKSFSKFQESRLATLNEMLQGILQVKEPARWKTL